MRKIILYLVIFFCTVGWNRASAQNICSCWQNVDTNNGWHVVPFAWDSDGNYAPSPPLYQNDDGVTNAIHLPFNFCYFGQSFDSVFINNNGNISFLQPYSSFNPAGFPLVGWLMIAPFWADVDTRNPVSGVVYYKITPTYMIVQWDTVGFFNMNAYRRNSFQVIISNGHDPIIPNGNNVEFCYDTMQWTTGDASNGDSGFDGNPADPATVGANAGNGINYIQFGLFGVGGANYLGQYPPLPYDGVSWLNGRTFVFNVCGSPPPIESGVTACDTFKICMGDTVDIPLMFLSPNQNDTTRSGLSPPVLSGVSIIKNNPGITDSLEIQIVGNAFNVGTHIIHLYGYVSNVNPHDTSFVQFVLQVDSGATGHIVASADTICTGSSVTIKAVSNASSYLWSNGSTIDSIVVSPLVTTTYSVQLSKGTCQSNLQFTVVVLASVSGSFTPAPNPQCAGRLVIFTNNTVGANAYRWNFGDTLSGPADSSSLQNPSHTFDSAGTYTVTLIARNTGGGCKIDTAVQVVTIVANPKAAITASKDSICIGDSSVLTASGGSAYLWEPGMQNSQIISVMPNSTSTYTVVVSNGNCSDSARITVFAEKTPVVSNPAPAELCPGGNVQLAVNVLWGTNFLWSPNLDLTSDSVSNPFANPPSTTTYSLTVTNGPCVAYGYATVIVLPGAAGVAGNDTTILSGGTANLFVNSPQGGQRYKWIPSGGVACDTCPNTTANPKTTQLYLVIVTDTDGCTITDSVLVKVKEECPELFVPTAFSPTSGASANQSECVFGGCIQSLYFAIYDRWGNKVFETTDQTKCWDGTFNGTAMNTGEFVYYLNATLTNGKNVNQKGNITLIR